jgi:uncharacterized membrane protein
VTALLIGAVVAVAAGLGYLAGHAIHAVWRALQQADRTVNRILHDEFDGEDES